MSNHYTCTGVAKIDNVDVGNALTLALDLEHEAKEVIREGGGVSISVNRITIIRVTITLGEYTPLLLAIALGGTLDQGVINIGAELHSFHSLEFNGTNEFTGGAIDLNFPRVRFAPVSHLAIVADEIGQYDLHGVVEFNHNDLNNTDIVVPYGTLTFGAV